MKIVGKVSNDAIRFEIDKDGLDYALLNYCDAKDLEDPRLAKLWLRAQLSLRAIEKLLYAK